MDISMGILLTIFIAFGFCSGVSSNQLYLQPVDSERGYFTNDSFFVTCFTTDSNIDALHWIMNDETTITRNEGRIHVQPAGGNKQGLELVVENVQKDDEGRYVCSDGTDSISFNLVVYKSISFSDTPRVQYAPEGADAKIICKVKSDHQAMVTWTHNDNKINDGDKYKITDDGVMISSINRGDAGLYKCTALIITHISTQSESMDITVHVEYRPEWVEDQKSVVYTRKGLTANLSCLVFADPLPVFQWFHEDKTTIHNSSDYMIFNSENGTELHMTVKNDDQFQTYECRANNKHGIRERTIELRRGDTPNAPSISVVSEDGGTILLEINTEDDAVDNELKVTGFRVQYILKSDPYTVKKYEEFSVGEPYNLQNMSSNSEYIIQVAAQNAAGFGDYSDEIIYKTKVSQVSPVVSSSAEATKMASTLMMLIALLFWI